LRTSFPNKRRTSELGLTEQKSFVLGTLEAISAFYNWRLFIVKRTSKRRAWTTAHVRELKSLARKKTPAKKIAKALERTEGATRQKAFSMGLSLDSRV
jgi:hypothetical protein